VTVDRSGRYTPLSDVKRGFRLPRLSPDGNRIAIQVGTTTSGATNLGSDIWIFDRRTGALSRFTSGTANSDPIWTPDGRRIAFAGRHDQDSATVDAAVGVDIFWQDVDRTSPPELVYSAPLPQWPWSFTPDGKTLLFDEGSNPTRIRAVTVGSPESAREVVANEFTSRLGKLSKDGKWLAYTSNETGRMEVYVRPFPGPGGASQVSVDGGDQPMWSPDGRELFFRDGSNMVAAAMANGAAKSRSILFEDTYQTSNATNYDVLPGGGFIMLRGDGDRANLAVLVNWLTEIRRRTAPAR
jgi:Tol biopolymer transport system component